MHLKAVKYPLHCKKNSLATPEQSSGANQHRDVADDYAAHKGRSLSCIILILQNSHFLPRVFLGFGVFLSEPTDLHTKPRETLETDHFLKVPWMRVCSLSALPGPNQLQLLTQALLSHSLLRKCHPGRLQSMPQVLSDAPNKNKDPHQKDLHKPTQKSNDHILAPKGPEEI